MYRYICSCVVPKIMCVSVCVSVCVILLLVGPVRARKYLINF